MQLQPLLEPLRVALKTCVLHVGFSVKGHVGSNKNIAALVSEQRSCERRSCVPLSLLVLNDASHALAGQPNKWLLNAW